MSTSSNTYGDAEAGYDSFDNVSPWTTPSSSGQPSTQHSVFDESNVNLMFLQPCPSVDDSYHPQQFAAVCTDDIGTWMDSVQLPDQERQMNMPLSFGSLDTPLFDQDFVLFDDTLQPADENSRAGAEATTLLRPPIPMASPSRPHSTLPPSKKRVKHSHAIPRAPPRSKTSRPRLPCNTAGCGKTFSRASDLDRHTRNIHGQGSEYHECLSHRCLYRTRRKDKMQEHCQKVHAYARGQERFATIDDSDATTPASGIQDEQ